MESSRNGPHAVPKGHLVSARMPPVEKPALSAEVLRRYVRRGATHRPLAPAERAPAAGTVPRDAVDASLAAVVRGEGPAVSPSPSQEGQTRVVVAPAALGTIQESGLTSEGRQQLYRMLRANLGKKDVLSRLVAWPGRPTDSRLYQAALLDGPDEIYVFTFV